jgi:hypothetical protein
MNNWNLMQRLKRLERQLQAQVKDLKHADNEMLQPEMQSDAATIALRQLNEARRRMALEGDERYAAYRDLAPEPEVHAASGPTEIVMILNAARKRMNQENELARQNAAAAAAMEESKTTEA